MKVSGPAITSGMIAANAVTTAKVAANTLVKADMADEVVQRAVITIIGAGSAQTGFKGYMPFAGDIVAVSFVNDSTAAFTVAAKIAVSGGDVKSSTATLADNTSERFTTGLTNNTGLTKGAEITLTTGTTTGAGNTMVLVEVEAKLNAVA